MVWVDRIKWLLRSKVSSNCCLWLVPKKSTRETLLSNWTAKGSDSTFRKCRGISKPWGGIRATRTCHQETVIPILTLPCITSTTGAKTCWSTKMPPPASSEAFPNTDKTPNTTTRPPEIPLQMPTLSDLEHQWSKDLWGSRAPWEWVVKLARDSEEWTAAYWLLSHSKTTDPVVGPRLWMATSHIKTRITSVNKTCSDTLRDHHYLSTIFLVLTQQWTFEKTPLVLRIWVFKWWSTN